MISASLFFDTRRLDKEGRGQLRIAVSKNGTRALFSLGISLLPDQWKNGEVVKHKDRRLLNRVLTIKKGIIDRAILESMSSGEFAGKNAKEVVEILKEKIDPDLAIERKRKEEEDALERQSFTAFYRSFMSSKTNPGTRGLYEDTYKKIEAFCESVNHELQMLTFQDINSLWLSTFETYCMKTERQNTASRHLRDIRAVFNAAINAELTTYYPFRKFKIKHEETLDKSYNSEELRSLFSAKCYPGGEQEAVDMFKLMFCLIGINSIDLANAQKSNRGRIEYVRAKTLKPYTIKVEPEALAIIEKYAGKSHLVNIIERCPNYKTYFNRMGKTLRKVGLTRVDGKRSTGKAALPDICIGSARTSWATIAQSELDIPRDVIAAALGHHTVDVTSTYLRTDWRKKIDQANRKVLDWVLHGKI